MPGITFAKLAAPALKTLPDGMHADGGNLSLLVRGDSRFWIFRYRLRGRRRDLSLGPLHTISLAAARKLAAEARAMVKGGVCPIEARRAEQSAQRQVEAWTFKRCAQAYISARRAEWRNDKSLTAWESTLATYAYPEIGELPVSAVDTARVMRVLSPLWAGEGARTETASRLRGRIEAVINWATTHGYRSGENPARWKGHLENLLPRPGKVARVKHLASVAWRELPTFLAKLRACDAVSARCLEFAILTGARSGEARGMRWDEVEGDAWVIPAERMKAGRPHRVPLSPSAAALLQGMPRVDGLVFPGPKRAGGGFTPLSDMAMGMLLRRLGYGEYTTHGFRSTFRDWAAESTNFPREVAELCLAHVVAGKVEQAYQRSDLLAHRRRLMEAWAEYCASEPAAEAGAKVVALRQAAGE
jgi:integrase